MKFIATAKGFVKEASTFFNKDEMKSDIRILYTDNLRDARQFSKKSQANKCIGKFNIEGFVYSPLEHESDEGKHYEVKLVQPLWWEREAKVCYEAVRVYPNNYCDLEFLKGVENPSQKYHTYEQAVALAKEKNLELIKQLTELVK